MAAVDRFFQYAEQHHLDVRVHNMLWGDSQQPAWATTLLNNANSGSATAKNDLRAEISERIDYYVGDGDADANDGDRARRYVEMDLLNEHLHQPKYWNVFGAAGIADMFNETAAAVAAAGADARLYLNEYNVLQYGADSYGNWYREDVEEVTSLGGAVSGVGVQYYALNAGGSNAHSAARIQQILQNLSVTGLPITLSEFGVQTSGGTTVAQAGTYLNETMRMVFGTPGATTFNMWGFWANDVWNQAPLAALMDANWNLTSVGAIYQDLMRQWDTQLELQVGDDGAIDFTGFYGDYEIEIDSQTYALAFTKGQSDYALVVDLAADFNDDGVVDAVDLGVWSENFGSSGASGDANGDNQTDGADFLIWQQQLGMTVDQPLAAQVAAAAVPEPAALSLAIAAALALAGGRRRLNSLGRCGTSVASCRRGSGRIE
jgi:GH35 family endo-1,4-beta-xylanase